MKKSFVIFGGVISAVVLVALMLLVSVVSAQATPSADPKALVKQYYDTVANEYDSKAANTAISALLDPKFAFYLPNGTDPDVGLTAHLGFMINHVKGFPDGIYKPEEMIAEENSVAVRWTFTGTNTGSYIGFPPSGNAVTLPGMDLFKIKDGRITELRRYLDVLSLLQQMDAIKL